MRKLLVVIDMQNDFINGSLGTAEAEAIVDNAVKKIEDYEEGNVFATRDTHPESYLETQEGKHLPVKHCIRGSMGWQLNDRVREALERKRACIYDKPSFGSKKLAEAISELAEAERDKESGAEGIEVELIGLCTDICVVSNALLIKAYLPEVRITVASSCCAGVTPEKHLAALETMRSCQIEIEE